MLQEITQDDERMSVNGLGKTAIPCQWDCAYTISDDIARVRQDGKWYFVDKVGTLSLRCHMTVEDYYGLPAYLAIIDIEGLIQNAIQDYQEKTLDDDDLVRCLYFLADEFAWNIESMDISCCLREELEAFVFSLWETNQSCSNRQLLIKIILDFGLQQSYEKIIGSIMVPNLYDAEIKLLLEEVLDVNGMNIQNCKQNSNNADNPL